MVLALLAWPKSDAAPTLAECSLTGMCLDAKALAIDCCAGRHAGSIGISVLAVRWARKSSKRAAFLGWGVAVFGAGENPEPPPQVKIEEVNLQSRIKKDAEAGDADE
jgi:hypothetical protein